MITSPLALIAIAATFIVLSIILLVVRAHSKKNSEPAGEKLDKAAIREADHIFDEDFREELRNRGRLHFEKIINENAMFLQQDLQLTGSQLNEYMKTEIKGKLQDEFTKYEQAIDDAKQMATDSIQKTRMIIEEQGKMLGDELIKQVDAEKALLINRFQEDMADIINHYVLAAIGNQIDLTDQLEYIMGELEANKQAMTEDILNGA